MKIFTGSFVAGLSLVVALSCMTYSLVTHELDRRQKVEEILKTPPAPMFSNITDQEVLHTTQCGDELKTGLVQRWTGVYRIWWTETKDGHIIEFKVER